MRPTSVRLTTVTGAWLYKRAKALAARLAKRRGWGDAEVVDGFLVKATNATGLASAVVYDPPGLIVMGYKGLLRAGARDNYNSKVGTTDGPYDADGEGTFQRGSRFFPIGDINPTTFTASAPFNSDEFYVTKKDVLRSHGLRRHPLNTDQYPIRTGGAIYSGVFNLGNNQSGTPGFYWTNAAVLEGTGGYGLARIADMEYLTYQYQGDAPASASNDKLTLVVIPVVKNFDTTLVEGCVHWGHSGVWFVLIETPEPLTESTPTDQLPKVVASTLWTPDQHTSSFFHNGPWQARPDFPNFDNIPPGPLRPPTVQAWDDWWEQPRPTPAGGSRPNWTDAISVVWFNGRFVVNLKVNALNGVLTPGTPPAYKTAGGSACLRFDVAVDGTVSPTEGSYDIWSSPAVYGGDAAGSPYAQWVVGALDVTTVRCQNPAVTTVVGSRLVEVFWVADADRTDVVATGGVARFLLIRPTAGFRVRVTSVAPDGTEPPATEWFVSFADVGAGLLGPAFADFEGSTRINLNPPTRSYKTRSMDPWFAPISDRELAWLAYEQWDRLNQTDTLVLCVLNLDTGAVEVRSPLAADTVTAISNMTPCHLDCVQRAVYDEDDQIALQAVLIATPTEPAKSRISRDSGVTWEDYIANIAAVGSDMRYAYYVGNTLGGGVIPGRVVE